MAYDPNNPYMNIGQNSTQFGGYPAGGTGGWYGDPNSPQFLRGPQTPTGAADPYAQMMGGAQGQGMYGGMGGQYGGAYSNPYQGVGAGQGGGAYPGMTLQQVDQQSQQRQGGNAYASPQSALGWQTGQQQQPPQQGVQSQQTNRGPLGGHPSQATQQVAPFNPDQGLVKNMLNEEIASGGRNAIMDLFQEHGINPSAPGIFGQQMLSKADQLTQQAKVQSILTGMDSTSAMRDVVNRALGGQGVFYGGNSGAGVYDAMASLASGDRNNTNPQSALAYDTFFGPNSESAVANLLYGAQGGPMGQASQQSILNQAAQGKNIALHPEAYGQLNYNPDSWLQVFLHQPTGGR